MKRMRLHANAYLLSKEERLIFNMRDHFVVVTPNNEALDRCVKLWKEGGTEECFREMAEAEHPGSWQVFQPYYERLVELGFFEEMDVEHELKPEEVHRWTRMLDFLAGYEEAGTNRYEYMQRMRRSKVLVVGVGGMGSWVTSQLLSLGAGSLVLIDGDRVEASNLNRTAIYTPSDIGRLKIECVLDYAEKFAPGTEVEGVVKFLTGPEDLLPHLAGVDLVIGCADTPVYLIRQWISEACEQVGVPYMLAIGGRVGPLAVPGSEHACPLCEISAKIDKHPNLLNTILQQSDTNGRTGSVASYPAIVSGVVGFEALRFLSGCEPPVTFDAVWEFRMDMNFRTVQVAKHPACINCGPQTAGLIERR